MPRTLVLLRPAKSNQIVCDSFFELFLLRAVLVLVAAVFVFVFFAAPDEVLFELLFVLCGRWRRDGALLFVVFGRELRNAPRTSSSPGCCANTIKTPDASTVNASMPKSFDLILSSEPSVRTGSSSDRITVAI